MILFFTNVFYKLFLGFYENHYKPTKVRQNVVFTNLLANKHLKLVKMATYSDHYVEKSEAVEEDNVPSSHRDSILLVTDSYADLAMCLTNQCKLSGSRHNSVSKCSKDFFSKDDTNFNESAHLDCKSNSHNVSQCSEDCVAINRNDNTIIENVTESFGVDQKFVINKISDVSGINDTSTDTFEEDDDIDYLHDEAWKQHRKHFFVLSSAGKPIYT